MNYEQSVKEQVTRLQQSGHATILAIESSCDETAAAIVKDGREVVASIISSQIPLHAMYGGVVPEIASRKHVESIDPVIDECLKKADMTLDQVDAIAVTYGPGLVGALLIGVSRLLAREGGEAIFSCNLRSFKPNVEELAKYGVQIEDISEQTIPVDFARNPKIHKCYLLRRVK